MIFEIPKNTEVLQIDITEVKKQIRAEVVEECIKEIIPTLYELDVEQDVIDIVERWFKKLKEQNSIIDSLKPKCSNEMPKDIVCNCTKEQKGEE